MSKKVKDVGLQSFVQVIKKRFSGCGVRITRKMVDCKYESVQVRFPVPDKDKADYARAWKSAHAARIEIVSTDTGYTYQVWLETPARDLELANPKVYAELEGICDAVYKLAKRGE